MLNHKALAKDDLGQFLRQPCW